MKSIDVNDHPEIECFKSFLNNSAATEFNDLRLHLAQCSQCRNEVEGLTALQKITELSAPDTDILSEQQHQLIADYIDGRLSEEEHQQQEIFLHANPVAMKAALHYASHKFAMDKSLHEAAIDKSFVENTSIMGVSNNSGYIPDSGELQSNFWLALLSKLKNMGDLKAPIWLTVPVTAVLVVMLTINLFNQSLMEQQQFNIASYQDNAIIQFRSKDQIPGIGFFAKSTQLSKSYAGISLSIVEGKHFTLKWPSVPDAIKYKIRLQMFDEGNKVVLGEVTTEKNTAVITVNFDNIAHRYEWVLSGETSDARVFFANGGFVISKARIDNAQKDSL